MLGENHLSQVAAPPRTKQLRHMVNMWPVPSDTHLPRGVTRIGVDAACHLCISVAKNSRHATRGVQDCQQRDHDGNFLDRLPSGVPRGVRVCGKRQQAVGQRGAPPRPEAVGNATRCAAHRLRFSIA